MTVTLKTLKKLSAPPGTLRFLIMGYAEEMSRKGYSENTIDGRIWCVLRFVEFAEERNIIKPADVLPSLVERYAKHLSNYVRPLNGRPLSRGSRITFLSAVREYFRHLFRRGIILSNPASEVELPKQNRRLPRNIFSCEEAERLLNIPDTSEKTGLRDRAILELLYSTGMRRFESAKLCISDIDFSKEVIHIREGKGRKDRVIPVGKRAVLWIERYIKDARPGFINRKLPVTDFLFLGRYGEVLKPQSISLIVRNCRKAAGITKQGAAHIFRHTTATLMLENGADIRYVQEMLGHESLDTTKIYTKVAITRLKEIHQRTHPAEGGSKRNTGDVS